MTGADHHEYGYLSMLGRHFVIGRNRPIPGVESPSWYFVAEAVTVQDAERIRAMYEAAGGGS